jgi:hypothetical protein
LNLGRIPLKSKSGACHERMTWEGNPMTGREYRQILNAMSDSEFATFKSKWGEDQDREGYIQWFLSHPTYEARLCDLLGTLTKAEKLAARSSPVTVVQQIHGAQVVAGNVQGNLNVQLSITQILQAVEKQIEQDQTISEPEQKGLLQRLKDFAMHPYVSNLVTNLLYDGGKVAFDLTK